MKMRKVVGGILLATPVIGWTVGAILSVGFLVTLGILGVVVLVFGLILGGILLIAGD